MKRGKLSEAVRSRSVQKLIQKKAAVCNTAAASFSGKTVDFTARCMHHAANALAAAGQVPGELLVTLLLPEETEEQELKAMVREADRTAAELDTALQVQAEVTGAVSRPCVQAVCIGSCEMKRASVEAELTDCEILVTRWIGMETTAILTKERYEALRERFSEDFIRGAGELDRFLSIVPDAEAAAEAGAAYMQEIAEGGVFEALWKLGEETGSGMEVDIRTIPIRQETVEICEVFDLNPYESLSGGAMLLLAANGQLLADELNRRGIPAAVIGRTTKGKDRILRNAGQVRYLDKYRQDEIYRIIG